MKEMTIDLETRSGRDLKKCGVYAYVDSPHFAITLFSVSVDGGAVQLYDLACGDTIPLKILHALTDESVIKRAFNVNFERICLSKYLRECYPKIFRSYSIAEDTVSDYLSPVGWQCTMVHCRYLGLPSTLAQAGKVLRLEEQKMPEGKALIRYFCVPCDTVDGIPVFHSPADAPEKWEIFKKYNMQDVESEMAIDRKLSGYPVPNYIWEQFYLDQEINDRGIAVDMDLVNAALTLDGQAKAKLSSEMCRLTGVENPNSVYQLLDWLEKQGYTSDSLDKHEVRRLLQTAKDPVKSVLEMRLQLSKSSVKKYTAMQQTACSDNRARGMFSFYGASRTGRFSGRHIQLQNLPQNHIIDLTEARETVKYGYYDEVEMLYEDVPDTLSQLIRTAFVPRKGYKFIVADFSAIEARVIAWLAGETWRMEAFAKGEDIYCASASKMFAVPVVKNGINGHLRQKGKVAELACIAEGQLVLTNHGLIPIENVTTDDLLWDGESWVQHDGVIYKGEREVITYEGLTATPDHLVWVEGQSEPIQFGIAASSGTHLVQTGDGRTPIWLGENYQCRKKMEQENESLLCSDRMCWLWQCAMDNSWKFDQRKIKRLSALFPTKTDTIMAEQKAHCCKTKMRKFKRCRLSQLWCKRYSIRFYQRHCGGTISDTNVWASGKRNGNRSNRQQWKLRTRKYSLCDTYRKQSKQTVNCAIEIRTAILAICTHNNYSQAIQWNDKGRNYSRCRRCCCGEKKMLEAHIRKARLYDIRNAGRHHRFTVSGKLVHNCGYGGSVGAMKAMGGSDLGLSDGELHQLVTEWREASPKIVDLWWSVDRAVKKAVKEKTTTTTHGIRFICKSGMLFIELPSGRRLAYVKPRIGENKFGGESVTYEGSTNKKWERLESYGPKFVENIVQAIARDILCYALQTLSHCFIVAHVHDEIILEADRRMSVEAVCEQMARVPDWAEGLQLRADGYECEYYKKD